MGLAIGGVIIRQDINQFKAEQIVSYFFGASFIELKENELNNTVNTKRFDAREHDCIIIYKTPRFIIIVNYYFTLNFYKADSEVIHKTYNYFNRPAQIFAFEYYSSGDIYGYSIITNGKLIRWLRYTPDAVKPGTFGKPLNIELKLLSAKKIKKKDDNGELTTYYIHPDTNELIFEGGLTESLQQDVMTHEVDLSPDSVYDKAIERRYFRLTV
ncbi:MAG: hypothetical protein V4592_07270 [Bacteroidota bacterium]